VPNAAFAEAVAVLREGKADVVLGPSHDGGYYLIGLKHPHPEPFQKIAWSTASVLEETVQQCREAKLTVHLLPTWYDVDDAATLAILEAELLDGNRPAFATLDGHPAPHTKAMLTTLSAVQKA
jgi:glycosyltransferase A (GT-A) superfamily protein (DUF2064 family)